MPKQKSLISAAGGSLFAGKLTAPAAPGVWKLRQQKHPRSSKQESGNWEQTLSDVALDSVLPRHTLLFLISGSRPYCRLVLALECPTDCKVIIPQADWDLHEVFPDGMESLSHSIFCNSFRLSWGILLPVSCIDWSTCLLPLAEWELLEAVSLSYSQLSTLRHLTPCFSDGRHPKTYTGNKWNKGQLTSVGRELSRHLDLLVISQQGRKPLSHSILPCQESRHALVKIRRKESGLPSLLFVHAGCRMYHHLTWRKWKVEPSQLFLRSLKVFKDGNKWHESSHYHVMEALATTKKK